MYKDEDGGSVRFDPLERECKRVCNGKSPSPLHPTVFQIMPESVDAASGDIWVALAVIDGIEGRGRFEPLSLAHEDVMESWVQSLGAGFRSRIVGTSVEESARTDQSGKIGRSWIQSCFSKACDRMRVVSLLPPLFAIVT
jgi:hypothetical protein